MNYYKWSFVVLLILQNSISVIIIRYSRIDGHFLASSAIVSGEVLKFIISCCFLFPASSIYKLAHELFGNESECLLMTIPAILYFIQNNMLFAAISKLDPATFQILYQMKIPATALFSSLILGKSLNWDKWASLALLTAGVAIVQVSGIESENQTQSNSISGFMNVMFICILSGFTGVYYEYLLKSSKKSFLIRNAQMAFFSGLLGLLFGVLMYDYNWIKEHGFFGGYNAWTWGTIISQAVGGILVASVVTNFNNIIKGYATSASLIISSIASAYLFNLKLSGYFVLGSLFVIIASFIYGISDDRIKKISKKRIVFAH